MHACVSVKYELEAILLNRNKQMEMCDMNY